MGLFDKPVAVPGDLSSGEVPRVLVRGVEWDDKAEARFLQNVEGFLNTKLKLSVADAAREARWSVEAWLYRQMWYREIRAATECESPAEKQRLVKAWIAKYGREQAQKFADAVLDKKRVSMILGWGEV